jgi:hypothetical protein
MQYCNMLRKHRLVRNLHAVRREGDRVPKGALLQPVLPCAASRTSSIERPFSFASPGCPLVMGAAGPLHRYRKDAVRPLRSRRAAERLPAGPRSNLGIEPYNRYDLRSRKDAAEAPGARTAGGGEPLLARCPVKVYRGRCNLGGGRHARASRADVDHGENQRNQ